MLGIAILATVVVAAAGGAGVRQWARHRATPVVDVFDADVVAVLVSRGGRAPQLGEGAPILSAQLVVRRREGDELVGVFERPEDLLDDVKSQLIDEPGFITDADRPNLRLPAPELESARAEIESGQAFRFPVRRPVPVRCRINRNGELRAAAR